MTVAEQIYSFVFVPLVLSISLVGFIIGIVNVLKKKAPYFFTLIVFAVGCFVIEQLSLGVNTICGFYDDVWVGVFGVFGCNLFLLSANIGALDKVVDETGLPLGKRLLALTAPAFLTVSAILIFLIWKDNNMMCAVVFALLLLPAIPATYYNIKHLLLPEDELGLLKVTKGSNVASLIFMLFGAVYLFIESTGSVVGIAVASILQALTALGLALSAAKGVKQWEI